MCASAKGGMKEQPQNHCTEERDIEHIHLTFGLPYRDMCLFGVGKSGEEQVRVR